MTSPTTRHALSRRQLRVGDLQFDVLIAGESPLVVLSHGFPESSRSWHAQIQALAEAGYIAVGPDLRGYGGSSKPPLIKDYALMKSVGDVAGIADALGSNRFAVVGHDTGRGGLAGQTALALPERVAAAFALSIPFTPGLPTPPDPGVHGHPSRDVLLHTLLPGDRAPGLAAPKRLERQDGDPLQRFPGRTRSRSCSDLAGRRRRTWGGWRPPT